MLFLSGRLRVVVVVVNVVVVVVDVVVVVVVVDVVVVDADEAGLRMDNRKVTKKPPFKICKNAAPSLSH